MTREVLENGYIKLTGNIIDIRTGNVHHTVVCKPQNEKYFKEVKE